MRRSPSLPLVALLATTSALAAAPAFATLVRRHPSHLDLDPAQVLRRQNVVGGLESVVSGIINPKSADCLHSSGNLILRLNNTLLDFIIEHITSVLFYSIHRGRRDVGVLCNRPWHVVGIVVTSASSSGGVAASGLAKDSGSKSTSKTGQTWAIVGGVLGGILLLLALAFLCWRFSQRRFSSLENENEEIRWPELRADGQMISAQASTLNPLGTRRTGGAGIEMGDDEIGGGGVSAAYADDLKRSGTGSESLGSNEGLGIMSGAAGYHRYEREQPYLGASAAPYPPPQQVYSTSSHYTNESLSSKYDNFYASPSQTSHSHYSPETRSAEDGVHRSSSHGHSSSSQGHQLSSSHGHQQSSHGHSNSQRDMSERAERRLPLPPPAQPSGTPLLSSMPVGGTVSFEHLMSPQVGQLRARNL